MDSLINQIRVRFFGVGEVNIEEPSSSVKGRRIPPQKTQSFKGEKKRSQNWLKRQFSGQMNPDHDSNQMEYLTAVAAAAYAIKSQEESHMRHQRKTSEGLEPSFTRHKSKKEDASVSIPEPDRISKRFSGENAIKSSVTPEREVPVTAAVDEKKTEKASGSSSIKSERAPAKVPNAAPTMKKIPTFAVEQLNRTDATKPEKAPAKVTTGATSMKSSADEQLKETNSIKPDAAAVPKTDLPPVKPKTAAFTPLTTANETKSQSSTKPLTTPNETKSQSSTRPGRDVTNAEAWEKAEMAKIKTRYEKLNSTILSWEEKKKKKAKSKLDKTEVLLSKQDKSEAELEQKRRRSLQKYRSDIESIDQIAGGARAQAEERRRNEEFKAKEKANILRTTGKVPATCFCF